MDNGEYGTWYIIDLVKYSYMLFDCTLNLHAITIYKKPHFNKRHIAYDIADSTILFTVSLSSLCTLFYCNIHLFLNRTLSSVKLKRAVKHSTFYFIILFSSPFFSIFNSFCSQTFQHVTCIWYKWIEQITQAPALLYLFSFSYVCFISFCTKYISKSNKKKLFFFCCKNKISSVLGL